MPLTDAIEWVSQFPGLQELDHDLQSALVKRSKIVSIPAGTRIYGPNQAPESYLLLLEGTVRVQQVSAGGREIVPYRVSAGESCALTTACLMSYEDYPAEALTETDIRAVAISRTAFDDLIARSPEFRRFVFTAFSRRVTDLFRVIEEIAFQRVDIRLANKILALSGERDRIVVTHQQLASELGTAREVVGRMLSEFQRRGWISSQRGGLTITNRAALVRLGGEC